MSLSLVALERMLYHRGYTSSDFRDVRDTMCDILCHVQAPEDRDGYPILEIPNRLTLVVVTSRTKITPAALRHVLAEWKGDRMVLVSLHAVPSCNKGAGHSRLHPKVVHEAFCAPFCYQVVPWSVVRMCPVEHELVPVHSLVTKEELSGYKWTRSNLPCLHCTDPVAQYLGFQVGDVVKISRHDGSLYFRQVVL